MAACAASSIAFRAAVAPRAVAARKTTAVKASRANVVSCNAQVQKISVNDVKDHLDRGFVIVDIRDPEECAATGYKSSWKNIVLAAMDEQGTIHMNPNFLGQIKQEFPNTMSRMLIACDDGTFRSEKACSAIVGKLGYSQCKVIEGGIDAYLAAFPLTQADKVKWRAQDTDGQDLSVLVTGVDTRQAGEIYY